MPISVNIPKKAIITVAIATTPKFSGERIRERIAVTINDITGKNCLKQLIREKESWIDLSGNTRGIYFIKTDQENFKAQKVILK